MLPLEGPDKQNTFLEGKKGASSLFAEQLNFGQSNVLINSAWIC